MWYVTLRGGKILIVEAVYFKDLVNKMSDHNVVSVEAMFKEDNGVWCLEKHKDD